VPDERVEIPVDEAVQTLAIAGTAPLAGGKSCKQKSERQKRGKFHFKRILPERPHLVFPPS
jgi:hypothetical protein